MLSRRHFIKKLLAFIALLSGGGALLAQTLKRDSAVDALEDIKSAGVSEKPVESAQPAEGSNKLLFSFFLLSDLHISDGISTMTDKLHSALKDVSDFEAPVDMIFLGGDLTDLGRDTDYKLLRSVLNRYKLPPLHANMGNHDYYDIWIDKNGEFAKDTVPNGKTDAMSTERFKKFFGYKEKPYNEFWVGDVHLILLSQEAYVGDKPEYGEGAWYSDEQLAWLEKLMKQHEAGKPALLFIHQPLPAPDTDGGTHQLVRAKQFRSILKPYKNVFVFSGHTHRNFVGESHYNNQNSFHWFNNASVGKTRNPQNNNTSQGMYVQVYSKEVTVRGREFSDRSWIDSAEWKVPLV